MVHLMGHFAGNVQINSLVNCLSGLGCRPAGNYCAGCVFFFAKRVNPQRRAVHKGDFPRRLLGGYGLGEDPLIPDLSPVVQAKGLKVLKPQQRRQSGIVPHLRMLVQGQMHGVQAHIMIKQEFKALPVISGHPQRRAPKQPVMHKEHSRAQSRRPLKGFHAGVYPKGDFADFAAVVVNL